MSRLHRSMLSQRAACEAFAYSLACPVCTGTVAKSPHRGDAFEAGDTAKDIGLDGRNQRTQSV